MIYSLIAYEHGLEAARIGTVALAVAYAELRLFVGLGEVLIEATAGRPTMPGPEVTLLGIVLVAAGFVLGWSTLSTAASFAAPVALVVLAILAWLKLRT